MTVPRVTKLVLLRDLVGKTVILLEDKRTRGGDIFPRGTEMIVSGTWRSGISLEDAKDPTRWIGHVRIDFQRGRGLINAPFVIKDIA